MASSSVSQDDIELDHEMTSRRSKLRMARARNFNPSRAGGGGDDGEEADAESVGGAPWVSVAGLPSAGRSAEQDISPKPLNRLKEKRVRPSVASKSKQQPRDRRKLREKRRSCGVVHVPSTESTGGSSGDPEADGSPSISPDCRCPPLSGQQGGCASSPPHHHHPVDAARPRRPLHVKPRNKSPSDLEADDEDNEDYDSLNMSGSTISLAQPSSGLVGATPPAAHHHRPVPHSASRAELQRPCGGQRSSVQDSAAELQYARQENRRLLQLLAEREQRIAELERRLIAVTGHPCPSAPHSLDSTTSSAAIAAALESLTTD